MGTLREAKMLEQKSDNLQYNMLTCWVNGTNDSSTMRLMFQALFFFIISYKLRALKSLFFYFSYKFTKIKIKSFEYPKSIRNHKKIMLGTSDACTLGIRALF